MAGFKQTAIGTLPEDWGVCEIKDLVLDTETRNPEKEPAKKIKYVDVSSVSNQTFSVIGHQDFLGKNAPGRARKVVYTNDVIFATVRPTLKRIAKISQEYNGEYCSTAFCVLRANKDKLNFEFLYQYLLTNFFVTEIAKYQSGASYPAVRDDDVKKTKMPYPPLNEQSNIAKILTIIQSAIEAQEKIIQTTTELKKALMQKLLTEGLKGEPQKETEIGLVPESWEVVTINKLGEIITGTTPSTKNKEFYENGGFQFVSPADLGSTKYVYKTDKEISGEGLKVARVLPKESVLVVCIGSTIGKVGLTFENKSITNQQINAIICKEEFNHHFIYYILDYKSDYIRSLATPSPVPIISKGKFQQGVVPVTKSRKEQNEIAKILSVLDEKIEKTRHRKEILQVLFKSMLHHLMTGQIRVKDLRFS
ncbi:MAG TPA: restriction endonuclease subunit S [Candidatus Wujingus californicus]|uniref:restriction endonuclease subunit S n=1 Tax=Candidatus Wujingus californicus TaxID=3367618 RepID=UPI001D833D4E|nr:restriction endonuclease subunit S [Planctomycetota bacterium]